jgi:aspartate racemase
VPRHIGIVAVSVEGAALCYREIAAAAGAVLGRHDHPPMSMHTHPLAGYMQHVRAGDWQQVAALMIDSARRLTSIGAELIACPDNTVHQAWAGAAAGSSCPWLHIARVVAEAASDRGLRRLGVLGTRYLVEGPVYREALAAAGIGFVTPGPEQREKINGIIFDELVNGKFLQGSKGYLLNVIAELAEAGCDGVVLGCTEIPLIVEQQDSPVPLLDSTRLLARAALARAME